MKSQSILNTLHTYFNMFSHQKGPSFLFLENMSSGFNCVCVSDSGFINVLQPPMLEFIQYAAEHSGECDLLLGCKFDGPVVKVCT